MLPQHRFQFTPEVNKKNRFAMMDSYLCFNFSTILSYCQLGFAVNLKLMEIYGTFFYGGHVFPFELSLHSRVADPIPVRS